LEFLLEQDGKPAALDVKTGSTVTSSGAAGIRAFRDALQKNQNLGRGAALLAGQARLLDTDSLALPWGWMARVNLAAAN
jgi:hypothetical protein